MWDLVVNLVNLKKAHIYHKKVYKKSIFMDGKAQIQNHQEKPSHHCSVSKRVKAKFKFEMFPFFSNPFPQNSLKIPTKIPPSP